MAPTYLALGSNLRYMGFGIAVRILLRHTVEKFGANRSTRTTIGHLQSCTEAGNGMV